MPAALAYPLAALAEIAGCFAIWAWWRLGASALWLVPGVAALVAWDASGPVAVSTSSGA